ncbi:WASH complex subunit 3-like [Dysidea avara]|uniref:WASH complex subunit 3-like n=1 Tax=Dysidea avara TaxID=196820 RepID=UPI00331EAF85
MDEHGLPIVGAGVDYTKVSPLDPNKTIILINRFITHTTKLLNRFSSVCEERLADLGLRIQRLEISLNILEAKLGSISGLDDIQATSQYQPPETLASAGNQPSTTPAAAAASGQPTAAQPQPTTNQPPPPVETEEPPEPEYLKVKDDPRYKEYFRKQRLGVNPLQLELEMRNKGLDPSYLENPDAPAPQMDGSTGAANIPGLPAQQDSDSSSGSDYEFESD